jgi:two-component system OmpR family sensor kinase
MDGPVMVRGDAGRLRQIVDNLLGNAVVHTPHATPVVVGVRQGQGQAVVTVADEGPGLDAEQVAHVFDRFYRGSEARTGQGTGLGLSIVAALAAAHGGNAEVEASPGVGSVFTVVIPAAEPGARPSAPSRQAVGADPGSETPSRGAGGGDEHLAPTVRR